MKNKKGITLIALIITIIVLLILSAVALNTLFGAGGILTNSEKSVGQYNNSVNKEQEDLNKLSGYLENYIKPEIDKEQIRQDFENNPDKYKNPDQSTDNKDIAISEDGESVNLDLWAYVLVTNSSTNESYYELVTQETFDSGVYTGGAAYLGNLTSDGSIIGKIPAYIYNSATGKMIEVKSMYGTFIYLPLKVVPEIPSTITTIRGGTFSSTEITKIVIPNSVKKIDSEWIDWYGPGAFEDCLNLNTVIFQEGIESLGEYTFCDCISLNDVRLPKSLERIGTGAFSRMHRAKKYNNTTISNKYELGDILWVDEKSNNIL